MIQRRVRVEPREVAYIGDDLNDLGALGIVGFSACPRNAVTVVRERVHRICAAAGGEGCVREVAELILRAQTA